MGAPVSVQVRTVFRSGQSGKPTACGGSRPWRVRAWTAVVCGNRCEPTWIVLQNGTSDISPCRVSPTTYTARVSSPLEPSYSALSRIAATAGLGKPDVSEALIDCVGKSLELLAKAPRAALVSHVPGKEYFVFKNSSPQRTSRGINEALFLDDIDEVLGTLTKIINGQVPDDPIELHEALYTAAISYPAGIDITKDNDKKSPGTFLENLVGHLVAARFGVSPTKSVVAPTLDIEVSLPTDFVFDLGPDKSRIHLPVKASTRERVIQVWAHQRVLDGMHGVNRFRGLLVVLAETNRQSSTNSITEVCLPKQWMAYQMYIAQLHRVYYFDVPEKYRALRDQYPFLEVKPFADFFYEDKEITRPNLAMGSSVEAAGPPPSFVGLPEDKEV